MSKAHRVIPATRIEAPTHYIPAVKTSENTYLVDFNRVVSVDDAATAEREKIAAWLWKEHGELSSTDAAHNDVALHVRGLAVLIRNNEHNKEEG